jgi:hypothetical protein
MSKIQLSELKATSLTVLNETETSAVVGGFFGSSIISRSYNRQVGANSNLLVQLSSGYYGGNGAGVGQTVNNTIG